MEVRFWLLSCALFVSGSSDVVTEVSVMEGDVVTEVSVMEGDSVTLKTDAKIKQQDRIKWYFNHMLIAQMNGELSFICTDVQCNKNTGIFKNRLKLDNQTGSLTIINFNSIDSGAYKLQILSGSSSNDKNFNITTHGISAAEREEKKSVMEGASVTLNASIIKNPNDVITWTFNDILIADISGDQSHICTIVQCKRRFTDRLELDQQTASLIITNTRSTDSGVYKLQIIRSRIKVRRRRNISVTSVWSFSVSVIDSAGESAGAIAAISSVAIVLLVAFIAVMIYKFHKNKRGL